MCNKQSCLRTPTLSRRRTEAARLANRLAKAEQEVCHASFANSCNEAVVKLAWPYRGFRVARCGRCTAAKARVAKPASSPTTAWNACDPLAAFVLCDKCSPRSVLDACSMHRDKVFLCGSRRRRNVRSLFKPAVCVLALSTVLADAVLLLSCICLFAQAVHGN